MFLLYKTDTWHSYASRDLLAVCTTKPQVLRLCRLQALKENETLTSDDIFNLHTICQTQGYTGEGEFHFEEVKVNTLL
ncbi:hypothetical protein [Agriterribacter sp.]|uniref:hypothetical protein n=1 Tax=Agriterribacter sp. TaxID=2821509 RepID=UPI002C14A0FF|nr:hypothetical protein [Agriterribacter sp.]HTN09214.1 hypothetical protein [Agriterribacter sp.]